MTRSTTRGLVLAAGLCLSISPCHAQTAGAEKDQPLPVAAITLYRSGVGYFERRGLIRGDVDVNLRFKADQINDILKSMVVLDLDGGAVGSVGYGSKEPLARRLASFAIDLSDNPSLPTLLGRLQGTRVRVSSADAQVEGVVIGREDRRIPAEGGQLTAPYLNLLTSSGLRSVNIHEVASFEILDPALATELARALDVLAEHRADNVKTVDLSLRGRGERRVVVAYVSEMPVWKTSYRLVLPEGEGEPTLQGWAIVENTTDEDWEGVRLSLVAGRPVSFSMDLYEPLFIRRPMVPVPVLAGVAPRVYDKTEVMRGALRSAESEKAGEPTAGFQARRSQLAPSGGNGGLVAPNTDARMLPGDSAAEMWANLDPSMGPAAVAQGVDVGEVFQFQVEAPVSVQRQRSAMLPIIGEKVSGRRVSIFSAGDGSSHPMRGVEITNSTALQLLPGPISVYDGPAYAGDAQIGHVVPGDKRLLAYSVDLPVEVATKSEGDQQLQTIVIANGLLVETSKHRTTTRYAIENKDDKRARTVIIEHPKREGWELVSPKDPEGQTESVYRFELGVASKKAASLEVTQEWIRRQTYSVTGYDLGTLLRHSQGGKVSEAVIAAVREAARLQAVIQGTERQIAELDREKVAIDQDQARVRQNMASVSRDSDLYRRYIAKFSEQETRVEQIDTERAALNAKLAEQRAALQTYLGGLNVQ